MSLDMITKKNTVSFLRYFCQECMICHWMCSNAGQTQLDEGQPTESKGLYSLKNYSRSLLSGTSVVGIESQKY